MFCKKCGKEIIDNASFCDKCGAKVTRKNHILTKNSPEKIGLKKLVAVFATLLIVIVIIIVLSGPRIKGQWQSIRHGDEIIITKNMIYDEYGNEDLYKVRGNFIVSDSYTVAFDIEGDVLTIYGSDGGSESYRRLR